VTLNLDKTSWETVRFGDVIANINDYFDPTRDGALPYVAGPHIDTGIIEPRFGSTDDDDFPPTFKRKFQPGDVLLHSRGIEKVAYVDRIGVTGEKLFVLRSLDTTRLLPEFIPFLLIADPTKRYLKANFSGSVNKFLNWRPLAAFEFAVAPLPQQRRIADLLWATERHRRAISAEMATLPGLRRASMARGPRVASVRVDAVAEIRNGQTFPKRYQGLPEGDYPFFKVSDLNRPGNERWLVVAENWVPETTVGELRANLAEPGDVITVRVGAALRAERRRMVRSACLVDDNQLIIHPTGIESAYLWAQLSEVELSASRNDGVVPSINQTIVGSVEIPDFTRAEQIRLADQYLAIFDVEDALRTELNSVCSLTRAIVEEVFG